MSPLTAEQTRARTENYPEEEKEGGKQCMRCCVSSSCRMANQSAAGGDRSGREYGRGVYREPSEFQYSGHDPVQICAGFPASSGRTQSSCSSEKTPRRQFSPARPGPLNKLESPQTPHHVWPGHNSIQTHKPTNPPGEDQSIAMI